VHTLALLVLYISTNFVRFTICFRGEVFSFKVPPSVTLNPTPWRVVLHLSLSLSERERERGGGRDAGARHCYALCNKGLRQSIQRRRWPVLGVHVCGWVGGYVQSVTPHCVTNIAHAHRSRHVRRRFRSCRCVWIR
jgi:hypothetical protein